MLYNLRSKKTIPDHQKQYSMSSVRWRNSSGSGKMSPTVMSENQCCGSGMFIPDPGSWFLPIPDPGSRISDPGSKNSNRREGWKKIWCHTFTCSHKFHNIVHYFSFEVLKKKIWANSQRIIELFAQKFVIQLSKVKYGFGIRDPRSGIRDPRSGIRDPGSGKNLFRIPGSKRHRIPDPDPQHW